MKKEWISAIQFNSEGLIPAVVQDVLSGQVLMVAYMNEESLKQTLESGYTVFWSRSRKSLWKKGETSGHSQAVREIFVDCDGDSLLIKVDQKEGACHTGRFSCFYRRLENGQWIEGENRPAVVKKESENILERVYQVILQRKETPDAGSYVSSLFSKGQDAVLKKVAEESDEVILSSKNGTRGEIVWEIADLWFHTLVVMGFHGITVSELFDELKKREGKTGLKK
jgi:phosphoribosyl-ATP pyrophosphohydrolase/phosphoribosyl-AMP cyclohydrolase